MSSSPLSASVKLLVMTDFAHVLLSCIPPIVIFRGHIPVLLNLKYADAIDGADTIDGTDANTMDSSGIYIEDSYPSEGASQETDT